MVCGDERPDAVIAVAYRPARGAEEWFPGGVRVNVRHCTDRPQCVTTATAAGSWPPAAPTDSTPKPRYGWIPAEVARVEGCSCGGHTNHVVTCTLNDLPRADYEAAVAAAWARLRDYAAGL